MLAVGALGGIGRLGLVAAAVRAIVAPVFDPRSLFASGEQGVWYDPSDLSTLFQDSAGTVPVTGVEQPVGRMLDKSGRGNHATQTTAIDRPILRQDAGGRYYLAANGVNTWMQTNSIDFSSTDKVTVFAGLNKLAEATAIFAELSSSSSVNAGSFYVSAAENALTRYASIARGTASPTTSHLADITATGLAPDSAVISATHDIAGDLSTIRRNGVAGTNGKGDKGPGNFGNYPLYLFRRAGTSFPFSGNFYGLLIRGAQSTDAQITSMERWLAPKTGVVL